MNRLSHLGKTSGELFIKNKNVVSLHKEMEECKRIILNHSPYTNKCPKKLKRNQIIAYVLQQNERELLGITVPLTEDQHRIIEQRRGSGRYDEIEGAKFVRDWLLGTGCFNKRTIKKYPHENIPRNEPIE